MGLLTEWIKTNGFLTTPVYVLHEKGESLEVFWREAVNRDFKALKKYMKIKLNNAGRKSGVVSKMVQIRQSESPRGKKL